MTRQGGEPLFASAQDQPMTPRENSIEGRRFLPLEAQLEACAQMSARMARKHWPSAEREQYPFWIGILVLAVIGIAGMALRESGWIGLIPASLMLIGVSILTPMQLRKIQTRFQRQWAEMSADGELFKFLRDSGLVLGHPVEMGRADEQFSTHLDMAFPDAVRNVAAYLRLVALPDPVPQGAPPGLLVPEAVLREPPGSESHRVYEVEYRGSVSVSFSIRVSKADGGTDITIGFPPKPVSAETRDRLQASLLAKLQERLISAKIMGDIRDLAGVPAVPIPASNDLPIGAGERVPRAT